MLELPAILDAWKAASGQLWADLSRACDVDIDALANWRKGLAMPWARKAERLALVVGPVVGRTDLVEVIARDRAAIARRRAEQRQIDPPAHPTPRTLVIPSSDDRNGAA